jgi:tRNA nucleotidyltransferase/poly(A) polymerase
VRNFLLNKPISDIDVATTAYPAEIIDICSQYGLKTVPIGLQYGVILVVMNKKTYEVTTLREDIKTFGRHAEVKFSKSFEIDSNRRDFTINAIYMDKDGKIYDYHQGIKDIASKNIRFIGNARKRIIEDYLRILRYFRFVAAYGDYKCNEEYLRIISELKTNIKIISNERIIGELLKIFEISDSYKITLSMREILDELFALEFDSIAACVDLEIFDSLSNIERLSMLLKFSKTNNRSSFFPKAIKNRIQLKIADIVDIADADQFYKQLKRTKEEYRTFYSKLLAVNFQRIHHSTAPTAAASFSSAAAATAAKNFLSQMLDFCKSDYVDFKLKVHDLEELKKRKLSADELKATMIAAKEFWTNNNISYGECKKFAQKFMEMNFK